MQEEVAVKDPEAALEARRATGWRHLQRAREILQFQRTERRLRVPRPRPGPSRLRMQPPAPPSPEPVSQVQRQDSDEEEALQGLTLLSEDPAPPTAAPPPASTITSYGLLMALLANLAAFATSLSWPTGERGWPSMNAQLGCKGIQGPPSSR